MAKFAYKMQNILNIKYKLESQAKNAYAAAAMRLKEEEDRLASMYLRKVDYEAQSEKLLHGSINLIEIKTCKEAVEAMNAMIKNQLIAVNVAKKNLNLERIKLNSVMVDRKTHEKLRDNAFEEFKKEVSAEESKEIDQLVSYTYTNNDETDGGDKNGR